MTHEQPQQTQERRNGKPSEAERTVKQLVEKPRAKMKELIAESDEALGAIAAHTREEMKKPTTAAAIAGAAVVGAAAMVGIVETALGATAAYATYRALKKRHSDAE